MNLPPGGVQHVEPTDRVDPGRAENGDYSIFAGFYYGLRGACIVEFGSQHSNKGGKSVSLNLSDFVARQI